MMITQLSTEIKFDFRPEPICVNAVDVWVKIERDDGSVKSYSVDRLIRSFEDLKEKYKNTTGEDWNL